jgi:hypothetical protein
VGRELFIRGGLVLLFLVAGLLWGQRALSPQEIDDHPGGAPSFRQWWWQQRILDLAVQAGLILTGALAIAALLPRPGEAETHAAPSSAAQDEAQ